MGRTFKGAAAALDAVHHVVGFGGFVILGFQELAQFVGHQLHGADPHAAAAADAGHRLIGLHRIRAQQEQARGGLGGAAGEVGLGKAHHGTAGDDLADGAIGAAAEFHQVGVGGAQARLDIAGGSDRSARHRGDALGQGQAVDDGLPHGQRGADVLDHDAHVEGQAAARDFTARDGENLLFLGALRVFGFKRNHLGVFGPGRNGVLHGGDGLRLVVFDRNPNGGGLEGLGDNEGAFPDVGGVFDHEAVVRRQVGLALGPVQNQRVDRGLGWRADLDVGRKAGPAHAGDAGRGDLLGDGFLVERLPAGAGDNPIDPGVFAIRYNRNRRGARAGGGGDGGDQLDRARGGGMHGRRDKAGGFADDLAAQYRVALLDRGCGRLAEVLRHGDHQRGRQRHLHNRLFRGELLVIGRMNAAGGAEGGCAGSHHILTMQLPGHFSITASLSSSFS